MSASRRPIPFAAVLGLTVAAACLLLLLCYRFDNKYTRPRPAAKLGVTRLDMTWYDAHPFYYLVDGWAFYGDRLLTPEEIGGESPDAYFYLGRYGGFDLGDPDAAPHGRATYRAVILTDGREREYALELTQIYSRWRLWINGTLVESVGMGDDPAPAPGGGMVTFRASGPIEIVAAVADEDHFYSGMVYPPAFGSPERVGRVWAARLLLHGGACALALLIGALCLLAGAGYRFSRPYAALTLMCLCFCGSAAWPVFQALGLRGEAWLLLERGCRYGLFLSLVWVQGRVCVLPKRALYPACAAGVFVCLGVLLQPLLPADSSRSLMAFSALLSAYKWSTALWLLGTSAWALKGGRRYSRALLAASCLFASALVMSKLLPVHEPVLLGWFPELAGGAIILLLAGLMWYDTVRVYRDSVALQAQKMLGDIQLAARTRQAELQREYVHRTQRQLHESRSRLTLIRHYLDAGELDKLSDYLDKAAPAVGADAPEEYTGHGLTDAVLSVELSRAAALDIYAELELSRLPPSLPVSDDDLTSLLMNLLDNALEGCQRLPDREDRWLWLSISLTEAGDLELVCRNSAPPAEGGGTSKRDKLSHGHGLSILGEIAGRYGGEVLAEPQADSFLLRVTLRPARRGREEPEPRFAIRNSGEGMGRSAENWGMEG